MASLNELIQNITAHANTPSGIVSSAYRAYRVKNTAMSDDHSDEHVSNMIAMYINKQFGTEYTASDIRFYIGKTELPPLLHAGLVLFIAYQLAGSDTYTTLLKPFIMSITKGITPEMEKPAPSTYYQPSVDDRDGRKALLLAIELLSRKYHADNTFTIRTKLLSLLAKVHGASYARTTLTRWIHGYEPVPYVVRPALYKIIVFLMHGAKPKEFSWLDWFVPESKRVTKRKALLKERDTSA